MIYIKATTEPQYLTLPALQHKGENLHLTLTSAQGAQVFSADVEDDGRMAKYYHITIALPHVVRGEYRYRLDADKASVSGLAWVGEPDAKPAADHRRKTNKITQYE